MPPPGAGTTGPVPRRIPYIATIRESEREGLTPRDYHLESIESLLSDSRGKRSGGTPFDPENEADLDLLLTDAFLLYGSHLLSGRVNPETLHADWIAFGPTEDLAVLLQSALDGNTVVKTLTGLRPPRPGYIGMQDALIRYRDLAQNGGWPKIPAGATLRKGDRDERVHLLRNRLSITGDLDPSAAEDPSLPNDAVETAVRRFSADTDSKMTASSAGIPSPR